MGCHTGRWRWQARATYWPLLPSQKKYSDSYAWQLVVQTLVCTFRCNPPFQEVFFVPPCLIFIFEVHTFYFDVGVQGYWHEISLPCVLFIPNRFQGLSSPPSIQHKQQHQHKKQKTNRETQKQYLLDVSTSRKKKDITSYTVSGANYNTEWFINLEKPSNIPHPQCVSRVGKKNSVVKLLKSTRVGSPTNINRLVGNLSYHPFLKITGFPGSRWLNHQFQNGGNPNLEDDGSSPTKNNGETRKPTKNKNGNWTSRDFLLLFLVFF